MTNKNIQTLKRAVQIFPKVAANYSSYLNQDYCVVRTSQRMEQYFFAKRVTSQGEQIIEYHNDIYLMFHADKLDTSTKQALMEKIQAQPPIDPIRHLSDRLSPEQMCQFVRSRYCQSLSELRAYSAQLQRMTDAELNSYMGSFKPADTGAGDAGDTGSGGSSE
ncbi:internal scaffolding protein [Chicken microvirus mg7_1]|nr:internal scaffolding protein [Chicken microvirus mg7_1]